jgi:hypothetical protein
MRPLRQAQRRTDVKRLFRPTQGDISVQRVPFTYAPTASRDDCLAGSRARGRDFDDLERGQISRLLSRLRGHGLIRDTGVGPERGEPRAWSLTERGLGVLRAVEG